MKHATAIALKELAPLLKQLRTRATLREKTPGIFYWCSKAFLHFHEDPAGLFVDVRLDEDFTRLPVSTEAEREMLLKRIDRFLAEKR